jgi:hypothetical protein
VITGDQVDWALERIDATLKQDFPRRRIVLRTTMKWQWPPLQVGDALGIAFVLAILGMFVVLAVGYPNFSRQATNSGFGADWDCTSTGSGEPVCVKRPDTAK